ncbi:MAG TPA: response regulator transcription factor [Thermomicrobiales bacterium]|nr:response regulator transcription factor [Thermomicrobiales bacterium]
MKVLLVDDDIDLLDVTSYALRREGFNVIVATDGMQAQQRWEVDHPDLIVSDIAMPRMNGLELCQRVRQASTTPVILLTAANSEEQIIKGFELGADDYVTKPFSPRQLAMRIRAVWRRGSMTSDVEPKRHLQVGDLTLDIETHEVIYRGREIELTPIEFKLMYILAANCGRVVTSNRLVDYAWGYDGGDISLLKTHVSHIRKKLDLPQDDIGNIVAVPRVGYRLTGNGARASSR